ncbi:MAG: putative toxin-antitoxin system toxin component, PIN family [Pleurocapsa sp. SU_196_0]|nr:putative toxin-antitoxin system toxin component, PIN family [Pleurocapsa sp. SU_196_0]
MANPLLIVMDTMVVVSAVMGRVDASDARTLEAVETGRVRLALSDEWLRELSDVMSRDFILERETEPGRAFRAGLTLGLMGELFRPERLDWVSLTDRKDWWLLNLAYASGADFIVTRDRRVTRAATALGFDVVTPPELLTLLREK